MKSKFLQHWRDQTQIIIKEAKSKVNQENPVGFYLNNLNSYLAKLNKSTGDFEIDLTGAQRNQELLPLIQNLSHAFNLFSALDQIVSNQLAHYQNNEDEFQVNVLFLSKHLKTQKKHILFNEVSDALIRLFTEKQLSLFHKQSDSFERVMGIIDVQALRYRTKQQNICYNFAFHESSLLNKETTMTHKKIDMTRTSLVAVLMDKLEDFEHLKKLLDTSLPSFAGMKILIFTLNLNQKEIEDKRGIFAELLNRRKIEKIEICQIQIIKGSQDKQREKRVQLSGDQFAAYLQIQVAQPIQNAFSEISIVQSTPKFTQFKLKKLIKNHFATYRQLFLYALEKQDPRGFEQDLACHLPQITHWQNLQNPLQVLNVWLSTFAPVFKKLIKLCHISAKELYLTASTTLQTFTDTSIFTPSQVPSKPQNPSSSKDLGIQEMAALLQKNLFTQWTNTQVSEVLVHLESESQSEIWSASNSVFKGTVLAGIYLDQLVQSFSLNKQNNLLQIPHHYLASSEFTVEQSIDWQVFIKEMNRQVEGKNSLETSLEEWLSVNDLKQPTGTISMIGTKRKTSDRRYQSSALKLVEVNRTHTGEEMVDAAQLGKKQVLKRLEFVDKLDEVKEKERQRMYYESMWMRMEEIDKVITADVLMRHADSNDHDTIQTQTAAAIQEDCYDDEDERRLKEVAEKKGVAGKRKKLDVDLDARAEAILRKAKDSRGATERVCGSEKRQIWKNEGKVNYAQEIFKMLKMK